MRKIREANPEAAAAILNGEHKDWIKNESKKHTLTAEFFRNCFAGFFKGRKTQPDIQPDREEQRIYAVYCRDLCRSIHRYCTENPLILEDIHLNDQERNLIGLPCRSPVKWADEPSFVLPMPKPRV